MCSLYSISHHHLIPAHNIYTGAQPDFSREQISCPSPKRK